jgi:hypothetical protein
MKKLMTLMLGLTIGLGSVALFAQNQPKTDDSKMETKKKTSKKKKAPKKTDDATKKEGTR